MNKTAIFSLISLILINNKVAGNPTVVPAQSYPEPFMVTSSESQLPGEEEVFKALHILGLTSYKNVREQYGAKIAQTATPEQRVELDKAFHVLTNPMLEAQYALEGFLDGFHLKAHDSKIEKFDINYNKFKMLIQNLYTSFDKVYHIADPAQAVLYGKKIYARHYVDSYLKFNRMQTAYYMEAKLSRRVLERCKKDLLILDPSKMLFAEEFKAIGAEEQNLKNFEKMPGQGVARSFMAKKVK